MRRNRLEALFVGLAIVGMTTTNGCGPQIPSERPSATPIAAGEQGRPRLTGAELLMRNPELKSWRDQLEPSIKVSIHDYGDNRRSGRVDPEEGLMLRNLPDVASQGFRGVKELAWGATPTWRLQISVVAENGETSVWIMHNERIVPGIIAAGEPYIYGSFAALETPQDGKLIIAAEIFEPTITDWPRQQAA